MGTEGLKGDAALAALWAVAAFPDSRFRLADLEANFGVSVLSLVKRGFLRPADITRSGVCRICDEPHEVRIEFEPTAREWRYACLASGEWSSLGEDEVNCVSLAPEALAKNLASALQAEGAVRELVPGRFWILGVVTTLRTKWTAMLAHCIEGITLDAVIQKLPTVSSLPGLVLSTNDLGAHLGPVDQHRFSPLSHHLRLNTDGGLSLTGETILAALGRPAPKSGKVGRPTAREEILRVVLQLPLADVPSVGARLIPLVRTELPTQTAGIKDDTISRHINDALRMRKNGQT